MEDIWQQISGDGGDASAQNQTQPLGTYEVIDALEPLDAQPQVVARKCVPDQLQDVLFGEIDGDQPATYVILDAAKITNLPELLETCGLEHQCLFIGDARDELAHVAPWIVRLEDDNSFTRSLFTQTEPPTPWTHWGQDVGIYLRAEASLATLCAHFRKFTKVRMAGIPDDDPKARQFFRFYDPEQAALYFDAIRAWPDRMAQFYALPDGQYVARIVALSSISAKGHVFAPDPGSLPSERAKAFIFEARDTAVFKSASRPRFRQDLAEWLLRMDHGRFAPFSQTQLYALVDHGLREGDAYGFSFKEEYVYLLYMMSYFGGWFHRSGRMPELSRILLEDGRGRRANLESTFPSTFERLCGDRAEMFRAWSGPMGELAALRQQHGSWDRFSPKAAHAVVAKCAARLSDEDRALLKEFLARVEMDCDARQITSAPGRGIVVLFSFAIGHAFFEDPLFPWAAEMAAEHDSLDAALPSIADYALKRAHKMLAAFNKRAA